MSRASALLHGGLGLEVFAVFRGLDAEVADEGAAEGLFVGEAGAGGYPL